MNSLELPPAEIKFELSPDPIRRISYNEISNLPPKYCDIYMNIFSELDVEATSEFVELHKGHNRPIAYFMARREGFLSSIIHTANFVMIDPKSLSYTTRSYSLKEDDKNYDNKIFDQLVDNDGNLVVEELKQNYFESNFLIDVYTVNAKTTNEVLLCNKQNTFEWIDHRNMFQKGISIIDTSVTLGDCDLTNPNKTLLYPTNSQLYANFANYFPGKFQPVDMGNIDPVSFNNAWRKGAQPIATATFGDLVHDTQLDHAFAAQSSTCTDYKTAIANLAYIKRARLDKTGSFIDRFDSRYYDLSAGKPDLFTKCRHYLPSTRRKAEIMKQAGGSDQNLQLFASSILVVPGFRLNYDDLEFLSPYAKRVSDQIVQNRQRITF